MRGSRRGGDLPVRREMIQKRCHLRLAHGFGVALAVEKDEAPDPVRVRLLRAPAVIAATDRLVHPVEQTRAGYLEGGSLSRVV